MARNDFYSVSVIDVGGADVRPNTGAVRCRIAGDLVNGDSIAIDGESPQVVKRSWGFGVDIMSVKTALPARVSNLDLSACSFLGENIYADVRSLSLNVSYTTQRGDALGDEWQAPQNTKRAISGSITIMVPTTGIALLNTIDGARTTWNGTLTFTLNSVAITLPVVLSDVDWTATNGDIQIITANWRGQHPGSGTYPTAPTGTTTLLEKALNAWKTAVAIELETAAVDGMNATGSAIFASAAVRIENGAIVQETYEFVGTGAITDALTTA